MRRPAYMPTPVPTMLAMNAVMVPTGAPSHQPTAPPHPAPRNANAIPTPPDLLTQPTPPHTTASPHGRQPEDAHPRATQPPARAAPAWLSAPPPPPTRP